MSLDNIVKRNLQGYRKRAGFTQEEVAERLCVSRRTIVDYENNPGKITMGTYVKLADMYGVDLYSFFMPINFTISENR